MYFLAAPFAGLAVFRGAGFAAFRVRDVIVLAMQLRLRSWRYLRDVGQLQQELMKPP